MSLKAMKMTSIGRALAGLVVLASLSTLPVTASEEGAEPTHFPIDMPVMQSWSFSGFMGTYDRGELQRGLQVYREVCASCHGLSLIAFRNFMEPGGPEISEEQAKALAGEYEITSGPNEEGEMFERPGQLSDRFPSPFANTKAAAAANNGAVPPDLSLIAKARGVGRGFPWFLFDIFTQYQEGGPDYLYSLLTGYQDPPAHISVDEGTYFNPFFASGKALSMAPPLEDDLVEYTDGAPTTTKQYARDVTAFLMWAAEPKLEERKRIGLQTMLFLIVFAVMLYFVKKQIWARVEH